MSNKKKQVISDDEAIQRIEKFFNKNGYDSGVRAKIIAGVIEKVVADIVSEAIAELSNKQDLDPHGILIPLMKNDLTGVEAGLERWWKHSP